MSTYLIVNFDRKEYLRPAAFGERSDLRSVVESQDGVLTGLTVLLADGNNRGGGDLRSDHDAIGTWAGCRIAIVDDVVTDAALSEPGMEHVPLQEQVLSLGKDVSATVIEAILDGEKAYTALSRLNPKLVIPLPQQRDLPGRGAEFFFSDKARKTQRLEDLQDLFWVFGVNAGITPFMARKRLEQGLRKMADTFGRPERYEVGTIHFEHGSKPVITNRWTGDRSMSQGVVKLTASVRDVARPDSAAVTFEARFGLKGSTLVQLYEQVFPGVVFEAPPAIAVDSPEVAKLLSMIPNLGA